MSAETALRALGEPRRVAILQLVRDEARSVGEITTELGDVTQQAVSHHLRVLEDAGLVRVEPAGTRRLYLVRPEGLATVREFIEQLWPARLAGLKAAVETRHRDGEE